MRELSIVITVMNEEDNIKPLLDSVRNSLAGIDYEVILVDDGSVDKTKQQILEHSDDRTVLVELRKNYGQSTAMTAGIDYSRGKYVALLDGDLQNDPSDIPSMLELLKREDWDVVAGNRNFSAVQPERSDHPSVRVFVAWFYQPNRHQQVSLHNRSRQVNSLPNPGEALYCPLRS